MTDIPRCACCSGTLEPAQQLRFLVETDSLDEPAHLNRIRRLPARNGRPVPVCSGCQTRIESGHPALAGTNANPVRTGVLAVVGILSVGWLVHNLLLGLGD